MSTTLRLLTLSILLSVSCLAFADSRTLAFTQSVDGAVFAVYVSGPCPLGLVLGQGTALPTVTTSASQIVISGYGVVASYWGPWPPPCNQQVTPGYMVPASLGKLADGHYTVVWHYDPGQITGAFDIASGSLVTTNEAISNAAAVSGLWYDHNYTGSGFSVLVSKAGLVVTYYGWDAKGNRLWLISDLGPTSLRLNTPIVLNLSYSTEGTFDTPRLKPAPWGTLVLNFASCQVATASLKGNDGVQNLYLTQLAGVAGPGC